MKKKFIHRSTIMFQIYIKQLLSKRRLLLQQFHGSHWPKKKQIFDNFFSGLLKCLYFLYLRYFFCVFFSGKKSISWFQDNNNRIFINHLQGQDQVEQSRDIWNIQCILYKFISNWLHVQRCDGWGIALTAVYVKHSIFIILNSDYLHNILKGKLAILETIYIPNLRFFIH